MLRNSGNGKKNGCYFYFHYLMDFFSLILITIDHLLVSAAAHFSVRAHAQKMQEMKRNSKFQF